MTIFSGNEQYSASELRDLLAQWEPPKDTAEAISDLTGAIMCLCTTINILDGELRDTSSEEESDYQ